MKRKRFTEAQIYAILQEHESGINVADLARKHGVSDNTIYRWKSKYGGMELNDMQHMKQLEDENRRLKALVADRSGIGYPGTQSSALKKVVSRARRRKAIEFLCNIKNLSQRK